METSNYLRKFFLLILSFGIFNFCYSQVKIERELGIKSSEVPLPAREWLSDAFEDVRKLKWYLEISQKGKSYEAKFFYKGYFHSVEFDTLGIIEDVEIEIKKSEVPKKVWKEISSYFESEFEQVKVEKIQRQFSGSQSDLEDFFDENESEGIITRYEIVFRGKKNIWELWEALFDDNGEFITKIKVQIRSHDNLIF